MKEAEHQIVSERMAELKGKKLNQILRAGSMANFGFGDFVARAFHKIGENKQVVTETLPVPRLALHADCFFRLSCGGEILLARGDIFEPSSEHAQEEHFDWTGSYGSNRFEEIVSGLLGNEPIGLAVQDIRVSSLGDLTLTFPNGYVLEMFPDVSGCEECWRFFDMDAKEHLVVNGQGIEEESGEDE